jgi:hypothetical protein
MKKNNWSLKNPDYILKKGFLKAIGFWILKLALLFMY